MNTIFKEGGKMLVRMIFINLMCFFVVISIYNFSAAVFSEEIGYVAYGTQENQKDGEKLYTYYNSQGEDTELKAWEEKGYTVTKRSIREVDKTADTVTKIIAQVFALGILISFVYPKMWDMGNSDLNMVRTNHKSKDLFTGLKIGLIGIAPFVLGFVFLAATKSGISKDVTVWFYKLLNAATFPLVEAVIGAAAKNGDMTALQLILVTITLFIMPAVAFIGYYLGYSDFSIGEKLTYKKKN